MNDPRYVKLSSFPSFYLHLKYVVNPTVSFFNIKVLVHTSFFDIQVLVLACIYYLQIQWCWRHKERGYIEITMFKTWSVTVHWQYKYIWPLCGYREHRKKKNFQSSKFQYFCHIGFSSAMLKKEPFGFSAVIKLK